MCEYLDLGNGNFAIVCGTRKRTKFCKCGRAADLLCDWKMPEGKTCDAPICRQHALEVAPDKHLCVFHQHAFEVWKKKHPGFDVRQGEQGKLFEGANGG